MNIIKFTMMINGLKYDTEQAKAICNAKLNFYSNSYSRTIDRNIKWFKREIISKTTTYIIIYEFIVFKSINNHYFLHQIVWNQRKIINDNTKEIELDNKHISKQIILPLSKEEAFNYYYNVYTLDIKKDGFNRDGNIAMIQLIEEKEAFDEILLA